MVNINRQHRLGILLAALFGLAGAAHAAEELAGDDVDKANNPLASATAFNVHDYYIGEQTGTERTPTSSGFASKSRYRSAKRTG